MGAVDNVLELFCIVSHVGISLKIAFTVTTLSSRKCVQNIRPNPLTWH